MTRPRAGAVIVIIAVLVIVIIAVPVVAFGWRWWHHRPPYGPEALALTSSLSLASYEEAKAALGADVVVPGEGDQLVLGRVSWQAPPTPLDGGWFAIFLIDKRTDAKPGTFAISSEQKAVSVGSHGAHNKIPERFPWLQGAGDVEHNGTWTSIGSNLSVADAAASPLTFIALFGNEQRIQEEASEELDARALPSVAVAPVAMSDLLLAMVYMGPDGQVYWAQRLHG